MIIILLLELLYLLIKINDFLYFIHNFSWRNLLWVLIKQKNSNVFSFKWFEKKFKNEFSCVSNLVCWIWIILMDVSLRTEPIWRQATCLRNRQEPGVGSLGEKSGLGGWTWRNGGAVEGADVGNVLRAQTGVHKLSHVLQWGHTCLMAASRACTHIRFLALRHGAHHHACQVGILWDVQYLQKLRHLGSALKNK